jgi:UDP-glucose 4-epimerase
VREILEEAGKLCGKAVPYRIEGRRAGDPARLVADATAAENILGWKPTRDLTDMLRTARAWHEHDHGRRPCGTYETRRANA